MKNIIRFRYKESKSLRLGIRLVFAMFLMFIAVGQLHANGTESSQQKEVTGTVTDENGVAMPGVSVVKEGTTEGTVTDVEGTYSLSAEIGDVLRYSFIGMTTQQIAVGENYIINVQMVSDNEDIEEVVVVGFGTKKKVNLSGAVASVTSEVLESRPVTNLASAIQGTVAGFNVAVSSNPNSVGDFNVRGITSIGSGSNGDPLFLIDNIESTSTEFGRLNPSDIESISVLKDAASASIYGSKAAFGVILITTKKAKSEKLNIEVNVNVGVENIGRWPEWVTDIEDQKYYKYYFGTPWRPNNTLWAIEYAQRIKAGEDLPRTVVIPGKPIYEYFHTTDWKEEVLNDYASKANANVSISQKTEKTSIYFGLGGTMTEGVYRYNNDKHKRFNMQINTSYKLTDWLEFSNNTRTYNNTYDAPAYGGHGLIQDVMEADVTWPLFNPDGTPTEFYALTIGRLLSGDSNTEELSLQTKFSVKARIWGDRLVFTGDAAYRRTREDQETWTKPNYFSNGPGRLATHWRSPSESSVEFRDWKTGSDIYNAYLTFTDTFNEKHFLTVIAGYNQEESYYNRRDGSRANLFSTSLPTVSLASGEDDVSQGISEGASQGIFGRINYIFNDKYIVEFNGRYDGSSRFTEDDRWVFNPSASLAWVVSKESFFQDNISFINLLKFRASYGSLGNQNVSNYAYFQTLGNGETSSLHGGERLVYVSSPGLVSPSLTWETVVTKNIGATLGVFRNRLNIEFDYFERETLDMLTSGKDLPNRLGTSEPLENAADLVTKGWELTMSWKDQIDLAGKPLSYGATFNLSDDNTWVTKFDNPDQNLSQYIVGERLGKIYGLVSTGLYQTQEEIDFGPTYAGDVASYPGVRPLEPGDIKFVDQNGDGIVEFYGDNTLENHGDRVVIGDSRSHFRFGLTLTAKWNGFDLRAFFQGVGKKDWFPPDGNRSSRIAFWSAYSRNNHNFALEQHNDHWTPLNREAYWPRVKSFVAEGGREISLPNTRYLQDASYLRCKNLTVGYTLPKILTNKMGINRLRFYVSGENLFEYTKLYKYLDPENLSGTGYPFQRTYSLGASVNF